MRTGRPSKERETARVWLEIYLSRGAVSAKQAKLDSPVSWHTTLKAKKDLQVKSKWTKEGWFWYRFIVPINVTAQTQFDEPNNDLEEPSIIVMDVGSMKTCAKRMIEEGSNLQAIEQELIASCIQWPSSPPYPAAYIKSIACYVVNGTPIDETLRYTVPI